ncbi:hypothetical protein NGG61_06145 [Enterococcus casseliflavus]|uniref:hypothetical protein n=1 Tax=Enterococcus casseliflavus TaxID=37734 RepID=UPI002DB9BC33|nr:hypothetical protein [Enterococcus casseliflavus]MEB8399497.1 hypothetical protein [Enterococcus casseliflavus]
MGRNSFFILNFCYRGNYVHADSITSNVLLVGSSFSSTSDSDSTLNSTHSSMGSLGSDKQEKSGSTDVSQESSEESISHSLDDEELEPENLFQEFRNDWVINDPVRNYDGIPGIVPFAIWDNSYFKRFTSSNGVWYINATFNGWRLSGNWGTDVGVLIPAIQNSIYTTNARVDDVRRAFAGRVNTLESSVSTHRTQISNAFSRISSLETWQGQQRTWNTATGNSISSLNSWRTAQQNLNTTYGNNISSLNNWRTAQQQLNNTFGNNLSSLNSWQGQQRSWNNTIGNNVNSLNSWQGQQRTWNNTIGNNVNSLNSWRNAQQDLNSVFGKNLEKLNTWQGQQRTWNNTIGNNVNSLNSWRSAQQDLNSVFGKNLENLNTWQGQQRTWNNTIGNNVNSLNSWRSAQQDLNSVFGKNLENLNIWQGQQRDWNSMIGNNVTALNIWQSAQVSLNSVHGNAISNNSNRITEIENTLKNFNWTDAAIIAAIIGLHDTWKSDDYMGPILPNDGDAVKLMKSVANKLGTSFSQNITLLREVFGKDGTYWVEYDKRWTNFPLWLQGLLNNYFDHIYNVNNKDSLLYRLLYAFMEEMDKTRFFIIEINDNIIIANDSLLIVIDWLRMIYSKPSITPTQIDYNRLTEPLYSIIDWLRMIYGKPTVLPFDYDLLQTMLEELSFGNVVNEAGTNIWDFLTELIKTLGDILTTALTSLTDIVKEILDLLGDLINQIIKLIVPENIDFIDEGFASIKIKIDAKFDSFLSLGGQIVEVVQPIEADFKEVISIDIMGTQFSPDFNTIDWVVVRFKTVMALSIWLSVAIYIFRKITGNGDLINDN